MQLDHPEIQSEQAQVRRTNRTTLPIITSAIALSALLAACSDSTNARYTPDPCESDPYGDCSGDAGNDSHSGNQVDATPDADAQLIQPVPPVNWRERSYDDAVQIPNSQTVVLADGKDGHQYDDDTNTYVRSPALIGFNPETEEALWELQMPIEVDDIVVAQTHLGVLVANSFTSNNKDIALSLIGENGVLTILTSDFIAEDHFDFSPNLVCRINVPSPQTTTCILSINEFADVYLTQFVLNEAGTVNILSAEHYDRLAFNTVAQPVFLKNNKPGVVYRRKTDTDRHEIITLGANGKTFDLAETTSPFDTSTPSATNCGDTSGDVCVVWMKSNFGERDNPVTENSLRFIRAHENGIVAGPTTIARKDTDFDFGEFRRSVAYQNGAGAIAYSGDYNVSLQLFDPMNGVALGEPRTIRANIDENIDGAITRIRPYQTGVIKYNDRLLILSENLFRTCNEEDCSLRESVESFSNLE